MSNLYLIGYRAAGKSVVGRKLAATLGLPFQDSDLLLVERAGLSISAFVENFGWAAFRKLESEILKECDASAAMVLATGGGMVLDSDNRAFLRSRGRVIWLKAGPEVISTRLALDSQTAGFRPPLTALSPAEEIRRGLVEREPLYREIAHYVIEVERLSPDAIVARIVDYLQKNRTLMQSLKVMP
ncbi:MAG TPA: shikimate kinase AroL [Proteobacteria bacterium]|nr:shikimate kinase AroL [Pseudomonadota bacterium]